MILSLAGSDPSGGAGLQMDIKTATKIGCHIATIPTCLTAQNSQKFEATLALPTDFLIKQAELIAQDFLVKAVKIGLLPNQETIEIISKILSKFFFAAPVILDPILISTTGKTLLDSNTILALKEHLIPKSYLITPNILEAATLSGVEIVDLEGVRTAAQKIQKMGVKNILIKGGHLDSKTKEIAHFLLKENGEEVIFKNKRIKTKFDVRGTGCMLATAISCFLSQNFALEEAIKKADNLVNQSIRKAQIIGQKLIMI